MINQLLSTANSRELNGVANNFQSIIVKSATTDVCLLKLNTTLTGHNSKLTATLNKKTGSVLTENIWNLEDLRDSGLKSFFLTVEGSTFRLSKTISEAGILLYDVIKRHGRTMYKLAHLEQTSAMESMFKELSSPAMVSALQTTSTAVIIEETKTAHHNFLDALDDRTDEITTKEEKILIVDIRKEVKNGLEKIMQYLNSITPSAEDPKLNTIYASLNQVVNDANSNIRARITRAENKKKEEPKK